PGRSRKVAQALRMVAVTARRSRIFIDATYRAVLARMGKPVATTATARELGLLIYLMATRGGEYVERGMQAFERIRATRTVANLNRGVKRHGYLLVRIAEGGEREKGA
ncbi:MAG: hypothetical protein OXN84_11870, partial [Albidovulum sp.]|nr:hypothetical protein [Albidovulum sp.]